MSCCRVQNGYISREISILLCADAWDCCGPGSSCSSSCGFCSGVFIFKALSVRRIRRHAFSRSKASIEQVRTNFDKTRFIKFTWLITDRVSFFCECRLTDSSLNPDSSAYLAPCANNKAINLVLNVPPKNANGKNANSSAENKPIQKVKKTYI